MDGMTGSPPQGRAAPPSAWVARFAPLAAPGGRALDLACGAGRHVRLLLELGYAVTALDRDLSGVRGLRSPRLSLVEADLESGGGWPLGGARFAAVVVANYLHRPLFGALVRALAPGGLLIYETFAVGNARFGRPRNPAFLLRPGELLDVARSADLTVLGYEDLEVADPRPACVQRIAARAPDAPS